MNDGRVACFSQLVYFTRYGICERQKSGEFFSARRLEGMTFRVLVGASDRQRRWLGSRRQEEKNVVLRSQRDEKQDPALNRRGSESDASVDSPS